MRNVTAEELASRFHEIYESLAPHFGYRTREASAVPFHQIPANNRRLMIATCSAILKYLQEPDVPREFDHTGCHAEQRGGRMMKFYDADLQSEHRAMQTRIATLEAENRGKDATIQKLLDGAVPRNSVGNVKDALRQAVKTTEGVRRKLADSESGPNCKYCGRDLVYCNCGATGPCAALEARIAAVADSLDVYAETADLAVEVESLKAQKESWKERYGKAVAENSLLRKALERFLETTEGEDAVSGMALHGPITLARAALARIPEAKPENSTDKGK